MKVSSVLASVATLCGLGAHAHITLNPNFGASSGNYFKFHVKVPHGTRGKETTKLVMDIPYGVNSAKPESIHGWEITVVERAVTPYNSHGNMVTTGPAQIIYEAICTGDESPNTCDNENHAGVDDAHLLEIAIQTKFGCDFGVDDQGADSSDVTEWQGQHAIWFPMKQYVSTPGTNDGNTNETSVLSWTGMVSGNDSWGAAQPKPSPYIFLYSSEKCSKTVDGNTQVGMRWGIDSTVIPPVMDQDAVKTKAEVLSWIDESQLTMQEGLLAQDVQTLETAEIAAALALDRAKQAEVDAENAMIVATAALILSSVLTLTTLFLGVFRVSSPDRFTAALVAMPRSASMEENLHQLE